MRAFTDFFIGNYTFSILLTLLLLLLGYFSYSALPVEQNPDVTIPIVIVSTVYPGASPEDVERDVTEKIEDHLDALSEYKNYVSYTSEGVSLIVVEYEAGFDIDKALRDVRDKVDLARADLPDDVEEPIVRDLSTTDIPTLIISAASLHPETEMREIADRIEQELERLPSISHVEVYGTREREIRVEVLPDRMELYGVSITELLGSIRSENLNMPAGSIDLESTRYALRTTGRFESLADIENVVVKLKGGNLVHIKDIARVYDGFADRNSLGRLNGKPSINFMVFKKDAANTIETSKAVKDAVDNLRGSLPTGIEIVYTGDQAKLASRSLRLMLNSAQSGAILVVAVILLFLGFRNALLVSLAIPLSLAVTFVWLRFNDYSFNSVTLFGLVLVIGILVDDAIIVVENIYRWMENGKKPSIAASLATHEVGGAILYSGATTIAAFAPMLIMSGVAGQFMKYIPITIIASIIGAQFAAHALIPALACRHMRISKFVGKTGAGPRGTFHRVKKIYARLLNLLLRKPLVFPSIIFALWIISIVLVVSGALDFEFFPQAQTEKLIFRINTATGTTLDETDRIVKLAEEKLAPFSDSLSYITANVGEGGGRTENFDFSGSGPTYGEIHAELKEDNLAFIRKMAPEIRDALSGIPGTEIEFEIMRHGPPVDKPVVVRIVGDDFNELNKLAEAIKTKLKQVASLTDVYDNFDSTRPEIHVSVDRARAADNMLSPAQVATAVRMAFYGIEASKYFDTAKNESVDVVARFPKSAAENPTQLLRLKTINALGLPIPLNRIASVDFANGIETIIRRDGRRTIEVRADVDSISPYQGLKLAKSALSDLSLPAGYSLEYAGESEDRDESFASLGEAMVIALFVIYLLLVVNFKSAIQPLVIMCAIPFSMIGVVMGLIITGYSFSMMVFIGVIALSGIVVNDAIVLVDYTNQLRTRGMKKVLAIRKACLGRMRPVLLTSITTIFGILPLAMGISTGGNGAQAYFWAPLGWAVIFGLMMSTVLVLLVVPSIYLMFTWFEEEFIPSKVSAGRLRRRVKLVGSGSDIVSTSDVDSTEE